MAALSPTRQSLAHVATQAHERAANVQAFVRTGNQPNTIGRTGEEDGSQTREIPIKPSGAHESEWLQSTLSHLAIQCDQRFNSVERLAQASATLAEQADTRVSSVEMHVGLLRADIYEQNTEKDDLKEQVAALIEN